MGQVECFDKFCQNCMGRELPNGLADFRASNLGVACKFSEISRPKVESVGSGFGKNKEKKLKNGLGLKAGPMNSELVGWVRRFGPVLCY